MSKPIPTTVLLPHDGGSVAWRDRRLKLKQIQQTGEFIFVDYGRFNDGRIDWPVVNKFLASRALEIEELFPQITAGAPPAPGRVALTEHFNGTNVLSQRQCLSLLSHAYFGFFGKSRSEKLQSFSLSGWMRGDSIEKLVCFVTYVTECSSRIAADPHWSGNFVSFSRKSASFTESDLLSCTSTLSSIEVIHDGAIENAPDTLHADFANEFIGGGVLHTGCVQEEILFVIRPECLVSMLFCDQMAPDESILIRGAERFSSYKGYAWTFKFDSPFTDATPIDEEGYRKSYIVALDAVCYPSISDMQYHHQMVLRESVKLYAALSPWGLPCDSLGFATGNWGCGAFNGDPHLKSILQWIVCSMCNRKIVYFPYGDRRVDDLESIVEVIRNAVDMESGGPITVAFLVKLLFEFGEMRRTRRFGDYDESLFDFLRRKVSSCSAALAVDTPPLQRARCELIRLREESLNTGNFKEILETIIKILSNIKKNPDAQAFRSLKKDNKIVESTLLANPKFLNILYSAGFEMKDSTIELQVLDLDRLNEVLTAVEEFLEFGSVSKSLLFVGSP